MKSIAFTTLGCRLNQSETSVIEQTFADSSFQTVNFDQPADIAVINTCTVTEHGDTETRRLVNRAVKLNPHVKIALIGCQAQIQKNQLLKMPNVQWVIGNANKMDIRIILESSKPNDSPQVLTPTIKRESFTVPMAAINKHRTRANIKIQDGCDFFCAFCEIPYARGRARSREFNDILTESRKLVESGYKEIVITGINVGTYQFKNLKLIDVIKAIESIQGLERIRISSIEPTTIPEELIPLMSRSDSKLCRYLHIPLQSANDSVLKLMKRKYLIEEITPFLNKAKQLIPEICLGTDIIVGFPGETTDSFQQTLSYLENAPIDYFHVFSYSERLLAKSRFHTKPVDKSIIAQRSQILRQLSQRKRTAYLKTLVGTTQKVLVESRKNELWTGLTDHYARIYISSEKNLQNQFLSVSISSAQKDSLNANLQ